MDDMHVLLPIIITVFGSVIASSGFWAFLESRKSKKDTQMQLLLGITRAMMIYQGERYIKRGKITHEEFTEFMLLMYEPYKSFGGNGLGDKMADEIRKLPMVRLKGDHEA